MNRVIHLSKIVSWGIYEEYILCYICNEMRKFVRYNRVLFIITGLIYHENDLNQPNKYFVRYNRVFAITEFVITEFDCSLIQDWFICSGRFEVCLQLVGSLTGWEWKKVQKCEMSDWGQRVKQTQCIPFNGSSPSQLGWFKTQCYKIHFILKKKSQFLNISWYVHYVTDLDWLTQLTSYLWQCLSICDV